MDQILDPTPDAEPASTEPSDAALPDSTGGAISADQARLILRRVKDPDLNINIVDLGLVYDCKVADGDVTIQMTLTAPGCGMGEILVEDVRSKVSLIPTVAKTDVELVFDPPWNREMMSETAKLELGML